MRSLPVGPQVQVGEVAPFLREVGVHAEVVRGEAANAHVHKHRCPAVADSANVSALSETLCGAVLADDREHVKALSDMLQKHSE